MKELELFFTKSLIEMKEQEITFVWINVDLIGFLVCLVHFCEIFIDLISAPTQQHLLAKRGISHSFSFTSYRSDILDLPHNSKICLYVEL